MVYLGNAFSLQMLDINEFGTGVRINPIEEDTVSFIIQTTPCESCIGHADTARVVSNILGMEVPCHRKSIKLVQGDRLIVAQVVGGRLPEGTTVLPEGMGIVFYLVEIVN